MTSPIPQLALMREGVDYKFEIRIRAFSFLARPLTCIELQTATRAAKKRFMSLDPEERTSIAESIISVEEKLKLASTSDVDANDAKVTDYVLERTTPDEIDYLFKQYLAGCAKVNPSIEEIPEEELLALVDEVKKNKQPLSVLIELSLPRLAALCLRLSQTSAG